ncbi:hypothetical protein [Hahella sp. HN01]|uniref:protein kinase domain-containing protein n=1 Tax=Hahella sp. HN01 TaxID=2847262 RepID=UPI001C1EA94B|nr:hypothetical protein [Hahella sp. HN01]MBU6951461.1 hypothetical protein [Hahella sp. HN01]
MGQTQTLIEVGGGAVRLLDKPLGQGADAAIYRVEGRPDLVAKIYHKPEQDPGRRAKLEAMLANSPELSHIEHDGHRFVQIAWPQSIVTNRRGELRGYLMPFVDLSRAVSLEMMLNRKTRQFSKLPEHYGYRLSAAKNLAALIAALHRKRHHVIDMKPVNINVYRETFFTALLDCDGFSIQGAGKRFTAHQYTPDYIAPEAIKGRQGPDQLGEEQDRFALAVILFQLLNQGVHPFQGTPKGGANLPTTNHERIGAGLYAYGLKEHPRIAPSPWSIHQALDSRTQQLFENAFTKPPYARPSAQEWSDHLHWLLAADDSPLQPCPNNKEHLSFGNGCPFCTVEQKAANTVKRKAKRPANAQPPKGRRAHRATAQTQPQPQYRPQPQPAAQPIVMPRKVKWGLITALSVVVIPLLLSAILNPVIASWRWPGFTEAALDMGWPVCDSDRDYNLLSQALLSEEKGHIQLALQHIKGASCLGDVAVNYASGWLGSDVDDDRLWMLLEKLSSASQSYERWMSLDTAARQNYSGAYTSYYHDPLGYIETAVRERLSNLPYSPEMRDSWRQRLRSVSEDHGRRALGDDSPGDELAPTYAHARAVVNGIEESVLEPLWKWTAEHDLEGLMEILPERALVDLKKVEWIIAAVAEKNVDKLADLLQRPAIAFNEGDYAGEDKLARDQSIVASTLRVSDLSTLPEAVKTLSLNCAQLYHAFSVLGEGNMNFMSPRRVPTPYYNPLIARNASSSEVPLKSGGMAYLVRQPELACALSAVADGDSGDGVSLKAVAVFLTRAETAEPGIKQKVLWDMARNMPRWESDSGLRLYKSRDNTERLVAWLVEEQTAAEWVDRDGETLAHYLVNWVSPELVQRLPSLGASTSLRNSRNLTLKEAYQRRLSAQGTASNHERAALEALGRRSPAEKLDDYFFGSESDS